MKGFTHVRVQHRDNHNRILDFKLTEVYSIEQEATGKFFFIWARPKADKDGEPYTFDKTNGRYELIIKEAPKLLDKVQKIEVVWKNPEIKMNNHE